MIDLLIAWAWSKLMVATGNYSKFEQVFLLLQCILIFQMLISFIDGNWKWFVLQAAVLGFGIFAQRKAG